LYKATITAKEIPSISQSQLSEVLGHAGITKAAGQGQQNGWTGDDAYTKAKCAYESYVNKNLDVAKNCLDGLKTDGSKSAVPTYLESLGTISNSKKLNEEGVSDVKSDIRGLRQAVVEELKKLSSPQSQLKKNSDGVKPLDQETYIEREHVDLATIDAKAKTLVAFLVRAVDPSTFTFELPLTMTSSDIEYSVQIDALPDITDANGKAIPVPATLKATTFTFRAPHAPENISYGPSLDFLTNDHYFLRSGLTGNGEDPAKKYIAKEVGDKFTPTLCILYHAPISQNFAISFGANLKVEDGARGLVGLTTFLGREKKVALTLGLTYGKMDRLNVFDPTAPFEGDSIPTKAVTRGTLFFGVTFRK
jgi:hypothetical protein